MNNDLISREALKGAIEQEHQRVLKINPICSSISLNMLNKILDNAPTVPNEYMRGYEAAEREYKRPIGEWYYNYQNGWHCSICYESIKDMPTVMNKADFNFCPNCGAKMKGEEE